MQRMSLGILLVAGLLAASSCGKGVGEQPSELAEPEPALSTSEIDRLGSDGVAFIEEFEGSWPDVEATFRDFADDSTFFDPTNADYLVEGKQEIVSIHRGFASAFPDLDMEIEDVFVTVDGVINAYSSGIYPPFRPKPENPPPARGLDVFIFDGDQVSSYVLYFAPEILTAAEMGCFAIDGCPDLSELANRYLSAWQSGDKDQVASLYSSDATFEDRVFGLSATGADEIADLAAQRFGPPDSFTVEEIEVWAQTDGYLPPGELIGIGLRYQWTIDTPTTQTTVDAVTLMSVSDNRIVTELVFYEPDSLLSSSIVTP
jgi:ketosteroid isomerase-like protein